MGKSLEEYNSKRDFQATPEPAGGRRTGRVARAAHALRYCIQKHDASHLHYDFRLELDGTLKSWAVPKGPSLDPNVRRLAIHVEDHPLDYADFEGHIPEGHYGAGDVIVWDRGTWLPIGEPEEGYRKGKLKFELQGEKLAGLWNLVRTHLQGKKEQWFLIKHRDDCARPAQDYDIVVAQPDSVLSERTIVLKANTKAKSKNAKVAAAEPAKPRTAPRRSRKVALSGAKATALPEQIAPELATLVDSAPAGNWRYEIKFDGYRLVARIDDGAVRLFTRNGHDWTARLPRQAEALGKLAVDTAWLDGEVIVANEAGVPDFQALQNAFDLGSDRNILYYLFDLMYLNGMDLRGVALEQRRAALATLLEGGDDSVLRFSEDFDETPQTLLDTACQMQMEGLIGKRAGSTYVSRRSADWIKLKCQLRQEFVVVGYSDPKGSRSAFGALLLGLHDADSGELRYAGKVGTGFNGSTLASIFEQLQPLEVKHPAVVNPPKGADARGVHWLKAQLLAEVAYAQMTQDGLVRHSVFHGLRSDKPASNITQERPAEAQQVATTQQVKAGGKPMKHNAGQVRITHPERIIDASSGASKMDLAEYYGRVAEWILPHLRDRPVALVRAPEGIAGELFFQKNAERLAIPGITTLDKALTGQPVMIINSAEALVGTVQMSTIELHTWNATQKDLERPDRFILDLDPDPALPWKSMVEATQLTLTLLDELGLQAFLKTSGGKGVHIVVPLLRKHSWDEVKAFSHAIVKHMAKLMPERFCAVSGPKNRVGRIFIDYLRNSQGATTITAFAARAREGLPVSVPIHREELGEIKGANQWNIRTLFERLAELGDDPWQAYGKTRQGISADMRKRLGIGKAE
ncbi:putative DNA ligase-like protein [compost metagenome]